MNFDIALYLLIPLAPVSLVLGLIAWLSFKTMRPNRVDLRFGDIRFSIRSEQRPEVLDSDRPEPATPAPGEPDDKSQC